MATLDYRVLGPLEVRRDGELLPIPAPRQRALLGLLLLRANEPVLQDELIDQLWGEDAPPTARASLQNQVHALRKLLGPESLQRDRGGYVLHVEKGELDLERFERLVAEARRAEPREKAAKLRAALSLWRGSPLVEFPREPFAQYEMARLEEERLSALEERIAVDLELGRHAELVGELDELVERYPLRERMWGQFMLALYRSGRQAEALATYRRAHKAFVEELGVEPGVDLRDLQRAILVQDAVLDDVEHSPGWTLERAAAILPWQPHERAESLYEYGLALMRTGERRRAVSTLESAARLAASIGDASVEDRARLYLSYISVWAGGTSASDYMAEVERAAKRFEARSDHKGLAVVTRHQYQLLVSRGRADEAVEVGLRGISLAAEHGDLVEEAAALMNLGEALAGGSTPVDEAIRRCEEILEEGERRSLWTVPPLPLRLYGALGLLLAQAGRIQEARAAHERMLSQAREGALLWFMIGAAAYQAQAEFVLGNLVEAAGHFRFAYSMLETEEDLIGRPQIASELACVLALAGDVEEARRLALDARAAATDDLANEITWRRALALVAARDRRCGEACLLSAEAVARAEATDWLTFRGQTLEEAAVVRRLAGDVNGEAEALHESLAVYERKGNIVGALRVREAIEAVT